MTEGSGVTLLSTYAIAANVSRFTVTNHSATHQYNVVLLDPNAVVAPALSPSDNCSSGCSIGYNLSVDFEVLRAGVVSLQSGGLSPALLAIGAQSTTSTQGMPITATFDPNGGTCPGVAAVNGTLGQSVSYTMPTASQCSKAGSILAGWSTSKTATDPAFSPGASANLTDSVTLYAVWRSDAVLLTYDANIANGDSCFFNNAAVPPGPRRQYTSAVAVGSDTAAAAPCEPGGLMLDGWALSGDGPVLVKPWEPLPPSITAGSIVTLYAKWRDPIWGVSAFAPRTTIGAGEAVPVMLQTTYEGVNRGERTQLTLRFSGQVELAKPSLVTFVTTDENGRATVMVRGKKAGKGTMTVTNLNGSATVDFTVQDVIITMAKKKIDAGEEVTAVVTTYVDGAPGPAEARLHVDGKLGYIGTTDKLYKDRNCQTPLLGVTTSAGTIAQPLATGADGTVTIRLCGLLAPIEKGSGYSSASQSISADADPIGDGTVKVLLGGGPSWPGTNPSAVASVSVDSTFTVDWTVGSVPVVTSIPAHLPARPSTYWDDKAIGFKATTFPANSQPRFYFTPSSEEPPTFELPNYGTLSTSQGVAGAPWSASQFTVQGSTRPYVALASPGELRTYYVTDGKKGDRQSISVDIAVYEQGMSRWVAFSKAAVIKAPARLGESFTPTITCISAIDCKD